MPPRAARKKEVAKQPEASVIPSRLEQLPAEILQNIFDLLHLFDESAQSNLVRPLSKSLAPFSTAALYRSIVIRTCSRLGKLATTLGAKPALAQLVLSLTLTKSPKDQIVDQDYAELLERNLENLLISLTRLKTLDVCNWDMAAKVVLSGSLEGFGKAGGKGLETIKIYDSFGTLPEPVSTAINNLRHLPQLATVAVANLTPAKEEAIIFSEIGFAKVTDLDIRIPFPTIPTIPIATTSFHATNIASLFPAVVTLELVQTKNHESPNFSSFITTIMPDSITRLVLSCLLTAEYDIVVDLYPVHQDLKRFTSLTELHFLDRRAVSEELRLAICNINALRFLDIGKGCKISFDCIQQLLPGIGTKESALETGIFIRLDMDIGQAGLSCQNGGSPVFQNGNLVPGIDWKRPTWKEEVMTKEQGVELEELAEKHGLTFYGTIGEALDVEEAFEKEEKWLRDVMEVMRTGKRATRVKWNAEDEVSSGEA